MSDTTEIDDQGVEPVSLKEYTEKAYLNYSMYVILDRALPAIGDGLKPVQRRIVYAMSELGLQASAKFKKSARTVGDVIGKFHPHGDRAAYDAMVLMAQDFSYRYPLVDGQGNWGSADDPGSFAAMRYTESRLTRYAAVLLSELGQGTVDWAPNFDGTLEEPEVLPAQVPNVLLNGGTGIAVGMATDIPPHNLHEVVAATVRMLERPDTTVEQLCELVQGPDFPTEAEIITPREELLELYESGRGSLRMRAVWGRERGDVVISALPHQVSGARVLEQIAQQMQARKLPMVTDLRDESDRENPTRLVLVPRSNRVDLEALMSHLFATTDLERSYRVNLNMIGTDGRPAVKGLRRILEEWLLFRRVTVRRRLDYRLQRVSKRLHVLAGYLIAFLNIDEVIRVIRTEEKPKEVLMQRFELSSAQAEAVLELKLRHLARLEEMNIRAEQEQLQSERDSLDKTLGSEARMTALIKQELLEVAEQHGDPRRSPLMTRDSAIAFTEKDFLSTDPLTIVLSDRGWIRAAKGHDIDPRSLSYKSGDSYRMSVSGRSNRMLVILDSTGRTYSVPTHNLPSARGQGEPLTSRINPPSGATFEGLMTGEDERRYLLASDAGYGFVAQLGELQSKSRSGKAVLKLPRGSRVLPPASAPRSEVAQVAAVTSGGYLLVFPLANLPQLARGKGVKIIGIPKPLLERGEESLLAVGVLSEKDSLTVHAGKRHLTLKPRDLPHYQGERGRRGRKLPRGFQHVDALEVQRKATAVDGGEPGEG